MESPDLSIEKKAAKMAANELLMSRVEVASNIREVLVDSGRIILLNDEGRSLVDSKFKSDVFPFFLVSDDNIVGNTSLREEVLCDFAVGAGGGGD